MFNRRQFLGVAGGTLASPFVLREARAQEFTFKLHHILGPKSPAQVNMIEPWVNRVQEGSNGRIKIEIYPSMQLGGRPPALYDQVRDGVADIVWTLPGYTAGRFPRMEVFELPFMVNSAEPSAACVTSSAAPSSSGRLR